LNKFKNCSSILGGTKKKNKEIDPKAQFNLAPAKNHALLFPTAAIQLS
jgi:hypothetical protein